MNIPKASVIMPIYNGESLLKESIESILCQSFADFEFIIIDDGSRDNTYDILNGYARKDNRIILMRNEVNKKIVYCLNKGLEIASTLLIARMDCGDVAKFDRLLKQYQLLRNEEDCVLVSSQYAFKNIKGERIFQSSIPTDDLNIRVELFLKNNILLHPTVMFRKIKYVRYRDFSYPCEDYDLWLNLAHYGKFSVIDEVLMEIRLDPEGTTFSNRRNQIKTNNYLYRLLLERLKFGQEISISGGRHIQFLNSQNKNYFFENIHESLIKKIVTLRKKTFLWLIFCLMAYIVYPKATINKLCLFLQRFYLHYFRDKIFLGFVDMER